MHTLMVVSGGFGLLGICALAGWLLGRNAGSAAAALVFLPIWLVAAAVNLYIGVTRAGYTVIQEAPMFLVVFGVPAAAALAVWWKAR